MNLRHQLRQKRAELSQLVDCRVYCLLPRLHLIKSRTEILQHGQHTAMMKSDALVAEKSDGDSHSEESGDNALELLV
jgi:hypothetical protein